MMIKFSHSVTDKKRVRPAKDCDLWSQEISMEMWWQEIEMWSNVLSSQKPRLESDWTLQLVKLTIGTVVTVGRCGVGGMCFLICP